LPLIPEDIVDFPHFQGSDHVVCSSFVSTRQFVYRRFLFHSWSQFLASEGLSFPLGCRNRIYHPAEFILYMAIATRRVLRLMPVMQFSMGCATRCLYHSPQRPVRTVSGSHQTTHHSFICSLLPKRFSGVTGSSSFLVPPRFTSPHHISVAHNQRGTHIA
jgi:hypothetical protein